MATSTLIMGESGTGKSSSIRNLDVNETFIINVLDKPLPFKGFKSKYTRFSKENENGNYYASDDHSKIAKIIEFVSNKRPDIKSIIVDDFQYIMANEFMRRANERGFDKFTEIAQHAWSIIKGASAAREDLDFFFLSHTEASSDGKVKCKTIGKMIDEKINLEGMFTIVLHTIVEDGKYRFLTQFDGSHIAKSPMDMFDRMYIENDLMYVKEKMREYFGDNL